MIRTETYSARRGAFTLLELLAVIVILGMLASALGFGAGAVLERGRQARCASNLRQLVMANQLYADDNGCYVPAAEDLNGRNLKRWHGVRKSIREPFDGSAGPLAHYLGPAGGEGLRACPSMRRYTRSAAANAFEAACGGYGYNSVGVGSQTYLMGLHPKAAELGMPPSMIADSSRTIMFADSAFPQPYGRNPEYLIEYSFAEPYNWVFMPGEESSYRADPSIHFRHGKRANVAWCDGHITAERLETRAEEHFTKMNIGWFGPADNTYFAP